MEGMEEIRGAMVIDLSVKDKTEIAKSIRQACVTKGFFFIVNTGVDADLVKRAFTASETLFHLSQEMKLTLKNGLGFDDRGYAGFGAETLDPKVQKKGDTKESFSIGKELEEGKGDAEQNFYSPNIWPSDDLVPGFRQTLIEYFEAVTALGRRLIRLLALSLELEENHFDQYFDNPVQLLRLLHYSEEVSDPSSGLFGAGAHSDYGMLTILATDTLPALQLWKYDTEEWITLKPLEEIGMGFIVNLGDMLERWTNCTYRSTRHRVVNLTGKERFSMPFFFEPNFDTIVECIPTCCSPENPPKFGPVKSGEYLMDKYKQTYIQNDTQKA
jgi:isopenicillin N synthase-like dioxygenase